MPGAAINMSLKSGTNTLHGQLYYFLQNPALNADKFFRLPTGKPQIPVAPLGRQRLRPRCHPEALRRPQQDILHVRLRGHLELRPHAV